MNAVPEAPPSREPEMLSVVRIPGPSGPVVRCSGELTVGTAEVLRREIHLLATMGHRAITLNLSGCTRIDVDGVLTLLDLLKRLRELGQTLVAIAGSRSAAHLLQITGIDWLMPVFPTEHAAALALRGAGLPEPAPPSWEAARAASLEVWKAIRETMSAEPSGEVLRRLTAMHPLCERSEEVLPPNGAAAAETEVRCRYCPLFAALGGRPADVGCRSIQDSIEGALLIGDRAAARARVDEIVRLIEAMPLPAEGALNR